MASFWERQKKRLGNWWDDVTENPLEEIVDAVTGKTLSEAVFGSDNLYAKEVDTIKDIDVATIGLAKELLTGGDVGEGVNGLTDAVGLTNHKGQEEAVQNAKDTLGEIKEDAAGTYKGIIDALGGSDSIKAYVDALTKANGVLTGEGKTVDKYMDPAADYNINKSVSAAQNAMAGQGGLSGGAAARQLQAVASEAASKEYSDAWERMQNDAKMEIEKSQALVNNTKGLSDDVINATLSAMETDSNLKQTLAQLGIDSTSGGWLSDLLSAFKDGSEVYSNLKGA